MKNQLLEYHRLNNSYKKQRYIYRFGDDAGFYSEFNNMVLGLLYCLNNEIIFKMCDIDANFSRDKGWDDFFTPCLSTTNNRFQKRFNHRFLEERLSKKWKYKLYKTMFPSTLLTSELFSEFRNKMCVDMQFDIPQLGIKGDLRDASRGIIDMIYRFNDSTKHSIEERISSLSLPDKYVSFHIRGGDKFIEDKLRLPDEFLDKSMEISDIRNAFIYTDDYSNIEYLKKNYPQWNFYYFCVESDKGYFHQEFMKLDRETKRNKLVELFTSMEICRKSNYFIGTFSSNVGMFMGMSKDRSDVYGLDRDEWVVW